MRSRRFGLLPTFCGQGQGLCYPFARAEALTGELRFCEAKWEFLKLPSNFSGESPEQSAGDLPSPEKGLARLAYSLASGLGPLWGPFKTDRGGSRDLVYGSLSLTTFFGKGQGRFS